MQKKIVEIVYRFEIKYEREEHMKGIVEDLKSSPILDMGGAGMIGGRAYGYSCKMKGKGKINNK